MAEKQRKRELNENKLTYPVIINVELISREGQSSYYRW